MKIKLDRRAAAGTIGWPMLTRPATGLPALALTSLLGLLSACGGSGHDDDFSPREALDRLHSVQPPAPLRWQPCDGAFQCSTLEVPVDHAVPGSKKLTLALKRYAASGERRGSLIFNPGGPGVSAVDQLAGFVERASGAAWLAHFDVVAFDPRGVGGSTPLDCQTSLRRLTSIDPAPDDEGEWRIVDDAAASLASECAQKHGALLPHLGTPNVARDMDLLRAALGDDVLHFLGFSYGATLGAWYAELFPARVGNMVLDGATDLRKSALELTRERAQEFERSLRRYFAWCDAVRCPWTQGKRPDEAFAHVRADIEHQPLIARAADRPASAGEFMLAVISSMYLGEPGWVALSRALADAIGAGDGSHLVGLADGYLQRRVDGSYPNVFALTYAVNCLDFPAPARPEVRAVAAQFASEAPTFGLTALSGLAICTHWPVRAVPAPAPRGRGAGAIVVIGTAGDPVTPHVWAEGLAEALESGLLLSWEGEGHTAYRRGSDCIDAIVDHYLLTGEAPADRTRCGR